MKYIVVIEKGERNFSAYSPDLPGCVSTGSTLREVRKNMREAIEFHLEGMIEDGLPIPRPSAKADVFDIARPRSRRATHPRAAH